MEPSVATADTPLGTIRARVMFALSILYLVTLAGTLHRHLTEIHLVELQVQMIGIAILVPIFLGEGIWRFLERDRQESVWRHLGFLLLIFLFPPFRIGARSRVGCKPIWLPFLGWQEVERELRRRLERFFSLPMILIAMTVVPFLAIQHFWEAQVKEYESLQLFLAIGDAVIWFAFALEFIIMVSVAKNKVQYCFQHWVDLAIIILPMVRFLPLLRALSIYRILRAEQLTRIGRLYRMQGGTLKAWRAVLLLEVIQRLTGQTLEKRLKKLQELCVAKEEELQELREDIVDLEKQLAQQKQLEAVREVSNDRP